MALVSPLSCPLVSAPAALCPTQLRRSPPPSNVGCPSGCVGLPFSPLLRSLSLSSYIVWTLLVPFHSFLSFVHCSGPCTLSCIPMACLITSYCMPHALCMFGLICRSLGHGGILTFVLFGSPPLPRSVDSIPLSVQCDLLWIPSSAQRDHRVPERAGVALTERILLVKLAECSRELAVGKANGSSPYTTPPSRNDVPAV